MAQLPPPYLERIEGLERKFEVISVIFKKYEEEFCEVFLLREGKVTPTTGSGRPRSRKPNRYTVLIIRYAFTDYYGLSSALELQMAVPIELGHAQHLNCSSLVGPCMYT